MTTTTKPAAGADVTGSDEDEDYMSDAVLAECAASSKVDRPGLKMVKQQQSCTNTIHVDLT